MYFLAECDRLQQSFTRTMDHCSGYTTKTTFYLDFSIADRFGVDAVKDTYKRAFNEWKSNLVFVTELVLVLNHKIWEHHYSGNTDLMTTYDTLFKEADNWCTTHLSDEDLRYYLQTTD